MKIGEGNGKGRKGNGEGRGEEVQGGIWLTQKFWRGSPMSTLTDVRNQMTTQHVKKLDCPHLYYVNLIIP